MENSKEVQNKLKTNVHINSNAMRQFEETSGRNGDEILKGFAVIWRNREP